MAEEEDPTLFLKKKRRKKKIVLDGDDVVAAPKAEESGDDANEVKGEPSEAEADDVAASLADLGLTGRKKKKKKKIVLEDDEGDGEGDGDDGNDIDDVGYGAPDADEPAALGDLDFGKKKKKTSKKKDKVRAAIEEEAVATGDKPAWADSDRDYEYTELLQRVFDIISAKNPEMMPNAKKTFVMKPPQVLKVGAKKTAFTNYLEICKLLHRQSEHLLGYILAELGTSGSVDGNESLVLKGRFTQRNIETVLKGYIREYVTCKLCKSPNTVLAKENRLFFLNCETCGSKRSVASIKSGYQAQIGRRSALRAKTST